MHVICLSVGNHIYHVPTTSELTEEEKEKFIDDVREERISSLSFKDAKSGNYVIIRFELLSEISIKFIEIKV